MSSDVSHLLQQIAAGHDQAFAKLVELYQHSLFAYLGRMGLPQAIAEELVQETFIRVWQHLPRFDAKRAAFSTWLFTIARRLALNEMSRHAYQYETTALESFHDVDEDSEQALEYWQHRQQLQQAMYQLSLDQRNLLALAYVKELNLQAIAEIEGCPVGTIKSRLHRARQLLQHYWEQTNGH